MHTFIDRQQQTIEEYRENKHAASQYNSIKSSIQTDLQSII